MPLIQTNAQTTAVSGLSQLRAAIRTLPADGRVTIMVHGFKYAPGRPGRCPHRQILAIEPQPLSKRTISWPRHLAVGAENLGIAFGWDATGSLWQAWHRADQAGVALARVLGLLAKEGRPADVVCHSLGARVVLSAMRHAPAGSLRTAILLTPADFQSHAENALRSPAGRLAHVLNVVSGENDLFDGLLEWFVLQDRFDGRALGRGLPLPRPNWTDLKIDSPRALKTLEDLGFRIAPPSRRVCHWSAYLRPGLFPLYRAVLQGALPLTALHEALSDTAPLCRSRFLERMETIASLPFRRKAPL